MVNDDPGVTLTYFKSRTNFPGFVCFVLYKATISGERLQDHWSSGFNKIIIIWVKAMVVNEMAQK